MEFLVNAKGVDEQRRQEDELTSGYCMGLRVARVRIPLRGVHIGLLPI